MSPLHLLPKQNRYDWVLNCPGKTPQTYTGINPSLTAGGTGTNDIDITGYTLPFWCNATLLVTDRSNRTSTTSTPIKIK